jgi:hypothetical protein
MSAITFVVAAALAWFVYRLIRSPHDRALRVFVACLALQVISQPIIAVAIMHAWGGQASAKDIKLIVNLALDMSYYALLLFFLFSAGGSRRRAVREAVLVVIVCAITTLTLVTTPASVGDRAFPVGGQLPLTIPVPQVAIFYLAGSCYFVYASWQAARWGFRYAAESAPRARWGLRAAATGLVLLGCAAGPRAVFIVIRWAGGTVPNSLASRVDLLVPIGAVLFVCGASYVGIAARLTALRVWTDHRRVYRQLRPLWEQLHSAFPHDALDRSPLRRWRESVSPRRIHRRYWRRVIEIRDGLVQLSPHLADLGFRPDAPAEQQVGLVRAALDRQRRGTRATSRAAVLVAAPAQRDTKADVEQLVRLARALEQEGAPA